MNFLKKLCLLSTCVCFFFVLPNASASTTDIKWYSYDDGMTAGKKQGKKIFINFRANWCGFCRKMEKETFKSPSVISYLNENFVSIQVDTDKDRKTALKYQVRGLPSNWFLNDKGEPVGNRPGYMNSDMFLKILKYLIEEEKTTSEKPKDKK